MTKPTFSPDFRRPTRRAFLQGLGLFATLPLAACAPARPTRGGHPDGPNERPQQAEPAVVSDQTRGSLETAQGRVAYQFWAPAGLSQLPLIVHLHELGEETSAGEAWRNTWLRAGYAVLQLQTDEALHWQGRRGRPGDAGPGLGAPGNEGEPPKGPPSGPPPDSPDKRKGRGPGNNEFAMEPSDAQAFFTPVALERQAAAVRGALEQLRISTDALFARTRGQPWALGGFGLGALLALRLSRQPMTFPASALLLISPTLPFAATELSPETNGLRIPCLLITGGEDRNTYLPQTTAALREALYARLPGHDRYLLRLDGGSHDALSGTPIRAPGGPGGEGPGEQGESGMHGGGGHSGSGRRGGGGGGAPGGGGEMGGGMPGGMRSSPRQQAQELAFAQRIGRAFLNAYVRDDSLARQWLKEDARRWLAERALFSLG